MVAYVTVILCYVIATSLPRHHSFIFPHMRRIDGVHYNRIEKKYWTHLLKTSIRCCSFAFAFASPASALPLFPLRNCTTSYLLPRKPNVHTRRMRADVFSSSAYPLPQLAASAGGTSSSARLSLCCFLVYSMPLEECGVVWWCGGVVSVCVRVRV